MTIVYRPYRPKRQPRRKAQAAAIEVPEIVTIPREKLRRVVKVDPSQRASDPQATIVTAKHPRRRQSRFGDAEDVTPEEHKRRGDAADDLFRRFKREIGEKLREE